MSNNYNNFNTIIGSSCSIGMTGSTGSTGYHSVTGSQGTAGPAGYSIMNIVEDTISRYGNRFLLKDYKVNNNTMLPSYIITDNYTLKEYQFVAHSTINLHKDFQSFINLIIINERDNKIETIING